MHPQLTRTVAVLPDHTLGYNQNGNQENCYIILLFLDGITFVRPESKRRRSWSRSRFRPGSESGSLEKNDAALTYSASLFHSLTSILTISHLLLVSYQQPMRRRGIVLTLGLTFTGPGPCKIFSALYLKVFRRRLPRLAAKIDSGDEKK